MNIPRTQAIAGLVLLTIVCLTGYCSTVKADIDDLTIDTGCTSTASYTARLTLQRGSYDVYAQLGRRGEKANTIIYSQDPTQGYGNCTKLGRAAIEDDRWQKLKRLTVSNEGVYTLQLASPAMANVPDANRPSIMLVPHAKSPLCDMTDECHVRLFGENAYLRPTGTLLNENSLRALVVTDPAKDTIKEVRYYTGKTLAYTKAQFEPFDTRYIEYGGQGLARVISYESGQQAVIETTAPATHQDTFYNFLYRLTLRYPDSLRAISWLTGGLILFTVLFIAMRTLRQTQATRAHHGFRANLKPTIWQQAIRRVRSYRIPNAFQFLVAGLAIVMVLGIVIIVVNSYLLQIVVVDGRSMEKSYFTGDQVLVNKLPKTIAALNNNEYLPNRGDVVIVRASFGKALLTEQKIHDLTLIKRVIGLPNERVVIKKGVLSIYNPLHPDGFQPDTASSWGAQMTKDRKTENIDIELGPSEIFVSGDNRPESIDSRFNGPLATDEIIGLVIAKW